MALAVDVGRERAADGDVARARCHRHEVAEREHDPHQRVETGAGVEPHEAALEVDVVDTANEHPSSTVPPAFCAASP